MNVLRMIDFERDKGALNQHLLEITEELNRLERLILSLQGRVKKLEEAP